jgi:hypothetical protein
MSAYPFNYKTIDISRAIIVITSATARLLTERRRNRLFADDRIWLRRGIRRAKTSLNTGFFH